MKLPRILCDRQARVDQAQRKRTRRAKDRQSPKSSGKGLDIGPRPPHLPKICAASQEANVAGRALGKFLRLKKNLGREKHAVLGSKQLPSREAPSPKAFARRGGSGRGKKKPSPGPFRRKVLLRKVTGSRKESLQQKKCPNQAAG